jgi:crotonobetainyl-CoA:carnitine CoA-transferase CaiB-like acyl-CoA transferase
LREAVVARIDSAVRRRSREELLPALAAADVPAGPISSVSEAVAAMGSDAWVEEVDGIRLAPTPFRLDGIRPAVHRAPPRLGEHTEEVLAELARAVRPATRRPSS